VKAGWEVKPLGEVCTLQRGFDLPKRLRTTGPFPLVTSNGPTDTHETAKVTGPGVTTGRSGTIGAVHFIESDFWPLNTALYVRDFHGNDEKYIWYLLQAFDLSQFASGAGVPTLNRNHVHGEMVTTTVSLEEQKRIVAVLDAAFEGLTRATEHAEANLQNARELLAGFTRTKMNKADISSKKVKLSEVCSIVSKLVDPKLDEYQDLKHLGAGNMISESDTLVEIKTAREEGLISGKHPFSEKDVLYSKIRPYLKKAARPSFSGLCSADVYPLTPNETLDRDFLFHLLMGPEFTDYAIAGSGRAGMPKVNRKHMFDFEFSLPPIREQIAIADTIDRLRLATVELEDLYHTKLTHIANLRQSLLQKAFAGELTGG
jgi:type I restriction enzyme S subunit